MDHTTDDTISSAQGSESFDMAFERRGSHASVSRGTESGCLLVRDPISNPSLIGQTHLGVEIDPYEVGPELTLHLTNLYFNHVNSVEFGLFGRKTFTRWVTSQRVKCHDERMLLYSVLAAGSIFAPELSIGTRLVDIASHAIRRRLGNFSLKCIQTRQILGLYAYCRGRKTEAWDYLGAALRGISGKGYVSEEGIQEIDENELRHPPCGMTISQMIESRRRTLWSAYTIEVTLTVP